MSAPNSREKEIAAEALKRALREREAFLYQTCGRDHDLRERVLALIRDHETATEGGAAAGTISIEIPASSSEKFEGPGTIIEHYKLLQQIGEGGCGVVYMAEQEEPVRRRVALKVIKPGMDTKQVLGRFEAERQALALMDHPNISKVLDAGSTPNGRPYFVMELVRGLKLTEFCDQRKSSTDERLSLFIQVCKAIQHAHQKGIIHRDIKPSNILITLNDGVPTPKVIDFGIAKATDQRLTNRTLFTAYEQFIGTPAYMSPEQAEMSGLDIDTRSDIYSLGVTLYELLTGALPFDPAELASRGIDEIRRVIREKDPPKPSTRLSTMLAGQLSATANHRQCEPPKLIHLIKGDLDWIVMKCLEKDRSRRYETANGLAADLERYLKNEPVIARPPSRIYQFQKSVRRNKLAYGAAAAVMLALIAGLAASTWEYFQEKAAHQRALAAERKEGELRRAAQASELVAKKEAAKSRQIAKMFQAMLEGAGPAVAKGRDAGLLRDILQNTSQRIAAELRGQPEVEAEIANAMGGVYWAIGDYPRAEELLTRVLDLQLGIAGGKTNAAVASAMNDLAVVLEYSGRLAAAEDLDRKTLAVRIGLFGAEHPDVAESWLNLGNCIWKQGKLSHAEEADKNALHIYEKVVGPDDPQLDKSLNNLGTVYRDEGKLADAEEAQRKVIKIRAARNNGFSLELAYSHNNLAAVLQDEGHYPEAEQEYRETLAMLRVFYKEAHPELVTSLNNLAWVLFLAKTNLAEAEDLNREALKLQIQLGGTNNTITAGAKDYLARVLLEEGKIDEAESLARDSLDIRGRLSRSDWRYFSSKCFLGGVLLARKDFGHAEPLLLEGYDGFKQRLDRVPANQHARLKDAAECLVGLYESIGKPDDAARWRATLSELK